MKKNNLLTILSLVVILGLALFARLYRLDTPLADWHSWRQVDTASVTRLFSQNGVDLLRPKYHDLSSIPSRISNPEGYRMVEVPLYNLAHLFVFNLTHQQNLDVAGRLTSISFSLLSIILIYLIAQKLTNQRTALLTSLTYALLPFNIYYSRTILPEPLMMVFLLSSFLLFIIYSQTSNHKKQLISFLFSAIFLSLSLLLKPYVLFFTLPIFYTFFQQYQQKKFKPKLFLIYWLIVFIPFILWRWWIQHFPAGIPGYQWLFNFDGIRFRPAWFRWLFAERIAKLILGYFGVFFLGLGLIKKPAKKTNWFFHLWALGILAYFSVIASGNVTHDYYQIIITPFLSFLVAQGIDAVISLPASQYPRLLTLGFSLIAFVFMLGFSWYIVKGYYQINNPLILKAGQAADQLLPADAKIIAPYGGDTAFLYQTKRTGWPILIDPLTQLIEHQGATHYVSINFDDQTNKIMADKQYTILEQTADYVIIQLTK